VSVSEPLNVSDWERLARERVDPSVWCYFEGGSGDELTLQDNVAAFGRVRFRPRVLVDVEDVSTEVELLGSTLSMPVVVAPIAYQDLLDPSGDLATARAAASTGTAVCVSTFAGHTHAEIAAAAPGVVQWAQLYVLRDEGMTRAHLEEAVDAGCSAVVLTVDTPRLGIRERDLRAGFEVPPELPMPYVRGAVGDASANPLEQFGALSSSVTWRDIERIAGETGLPVLVKGIVTREDAALAVEHGAAGIVVSNHGGRQLDGAVATLDALPEVVEAVGDRIPVLLDGGIRRGTDVVKALALGARAVLAGRAPIFGLAAAGESGVEQVLTLMCDEIELALSLLGCTSAGQVGPGHVRPGVAYDLPA
jgi:isopentenyl diphosphate isomerase/L-lactate dehydrogenase-like FMN-dependent dehydrogenase